MCVILYSNSKICVKMPSKVRKKAPDAVLKEHEILKLLENWNNDDEFEDYSSSSDDSFSDSGSDDGERVSSKNL